MWVSIVWKMMKRAVEWLMAKVEGDDDGCLLLVALVEA